MRIYIRTCVQTHTYTRIPRVYQSLTSLHYYTYMHTHIHTYIHTYTHNISIYIHIYAYIHTCMRTYTHTHTYIPRPYQSVSSLYYSWRPHSHVHSANPYLQPSKGLVCFENTCIVTFVRRLDAARGPILTYLS